MIEWKNDERGKYRVLESFVSAWAGDGPSIVSGYNVVEVRLYADGNSDVVRLDPVYVHSSPVDVQAIHSIFIVADKELKRICGLAKV